VLVPHARETDCFRAVALDPTHESRPGLRYVTVAVGRDYGDVPPTSGTFEGPFGGELTTHKRAAVTRVEYLRPRRRRRPGPALA
jgi:transglutaminase-like putative cysteine protease